MKMKSAKKASDIILAGVRVELDTKDGNPIGVTITDENGKFLRVSYTGWGLDFLVPEPPKMVERFQVAGRLKGIAFDETIDDETKALARVQELGVEADPIEMKKIEIAEAS